MAIGLVLPFFTLPVEPAGTSFQRAIWQAMCEIPYGATRTYGYLAARVGGAATGDEILVSGLLKALTESAGEFRFDEGREVELKGISGAQHLHAVDWAPN